MRRLRILKLHLLSKSRLRGDLIEVYKIVRGFSGLRIKDFFQYADQGNNRDHRFKLVELK